VSVLKELIRGGITEVLPAMRIIFLERSIASGRVLEDIGRPADSGHAITVGAIIVIDSDSYEYSIRNCALMVDEYPPLQISFFF